MESAKKKARCGVHVGSSSSQCTPGISESVEKLRTDTLAWQASLTTLRSPSQGKDAPSQERALAVRLSKTRAAAKAGEVTKEDESALASLPGMESLFSQVSPVQQLAEDIKSWQHKTGLLRFPHQANDATDEERKLALRCNNLLSPHISSQVTPGEAGWLVQLAKDTTAWRARVGRDCVLTADVATTGAEKAAARGWAWLQEHDADVGSMARQGRLLRAYDLNEEIFGPHSASLFHVSRE